MPLFVPASALGRDGAVAPSNRITVAGIGLGGRGQGVLRSWVLPEKDVQFVAICDVWKPRREAVKKTHRDGRPLARGRFHHSDEGGQGCLH